jgi:hypothetical protein
MTSPAPSTRFTPWQLALATLVWIIAGGTGWWLWTVQQELFHPAVLQRGPHDSERDELENILTGHDNWVLTSPAGSEPDRPTPINPSEYVSRILRPEARPSLAPWPGTVIARKMNGSSVIAEAVVLGPTRTGLDNGATLPLPTGIRARRVSISAQQGGSQDPVVIYVLESTTPTMGIS